MKGYHYRDLSGERVSRPPVAGNHETVRVEGVSFLDLVNIKAIDGLRSLGFGTQKIRQVVEYCEQELRVRYPLATQAFKTDKKRIYLHAGDGHLLEVLGGQRGALAWDQILDPFLRTLEYQNEFARRWWPLGRNELVVVDPDYGFGSPVVVNSGVRTELVVERERAGDKLEEIAYDFNLTNEQIASALRWEHKLAA